jgi:predicted Zn finger-like uncharacterized protein
MQIICPQCRTAYDVTPAALGSEGRQVRCIRCKTVWFAELARRPGNISAPPIPLPDPEPGPTTAAATAPPPAAAGPSPEPQSIPSIPAPVAPPAASPIESPTAAPDAPAAGEPPVPGVAAAAVEPVASPPAVPPPEPADIESVAARRSVGSAAKRPAHRGRRLSGLTTAAAVLMLVSGGLVIGRTEVVRALPQTASLFETIGLPVNLRELAFKDLKTTQELHDGVQILVIEGTIVATGNAVVDVPRLRFAIGAANGHEVYAWTALPARGKLAPGETLPFRTRLASPPEQGRTVKIRFFNRLDIASGLR